MFGFFQETGPCTVVPGSNDSWTTEPNMYGWDRSSNMIFIDQPDQTGFSYDVLVNGSLDLTTGNISYPPSDVPSGQAPYSFLNGTFSSGNPNATANTSQIAAQATWHFLQTWLATFPQYNPGSSANASSISPAGIHLFTESYGGQYAPILANYLEQQNALRKSGVLPASTLEIRLKTVGIINGLVDDLIQAYYAPVFAYNNTYGIQAISQTDELNSLQQYQQKCLPAVNTCRNTARVTDPSSLGANYTTDLTCVNALAQCNNVSEAYFYSGRDVYDIRIQTPAPGPPEAYQEYLNTAAVQAAIGASVNYTESNPVVQSAFIATGDEVRGMSLYDLAGLLRSGVHVAFIYGDADWICNWLGGEAVSLALAGLLPDFPSSTHSSAASQSSVSATIATPPISAPTGQNGSYAAKFPAAGYADIVVNSSYVGGVARQFGNLSFSRVYDSGHFVPYYQPETAFTIFTRIILGTDLSTGKAISLTNFSSNASLEASYTQSAPKEQPLPTCWIRDMTDSCSDEQVDAVLDNQGIVMGGVWYSNAAETPSSTAATMMDRATGSATGVYTATGTPLPTRGLAVRNAASRSVWVLILFGICVGGGKVMWA